MKKRVLILITTGILAASSLLACEAKPEFSKNPDQEGATENGAIDINLIAGVWYYQVIDSDDMESFITKGAVEVKKDGSYTYTPLEGDGNKGIVQIEYEEYDDGTNLPMFNFYTEGNSFWIGSYYDDNEKDTLWIGNGGEERLVRNGK